MSRVLIVGCGYVGGELAIRLRDAGHTVYGLRRNVDRIPSGVHAVRGDVADRATLRQLPESPDVVYYLAGADRADDEAYRIAYVDGPRNVIDVLVDAGAPPRRFFFVSSTAVYGQCRGEWVDERSVTEPSDFRGTRLLQGEEGVLRSAVPATIARAAGIYGPERTRLVEEVKRGRWPPSDGAQVYTNRIHRTDLARALEHLMDVEHLEDVYVCVDDHPAPRREVFAWLAHRLGVEEPGIGQSPAETGSPTRPNKRCSNRRLKATGFALVYPSFREGYEAMLSQG